MTGDPYREPAGLRCPHCQAVLVDLSCPGGCGEWLPHRKAELPRDAFDHANEDGAVWWTLGVSKGVSCPECRRGMMSFGTLYDYCPSHGAWVDARQRNNFRARFAPMFERASRVAEIAAEATIDPSALAARIAKLEHEVQWLRSRLDDLEGGRRGSRR